MAQSNVYYLALVASFALSCSSEGSGTDSPSSSGGQSATNTDEDLDSNAGEGVSPDAISPSATLSTSGELNPNEPALDGGGDPTEPPELGDEPIDAGAAGAESTNSDPANVEPAATDMLSPPPAEPPAGADCAPISVAPCEDGQSPPISCYLDDNGQYQYTIGSCPTPVGPTNDPGCSGTTELFSVSADGAQLFDSWNITDTSESRTGSVSLRIEGTETMRPEGGPFRIGLSIRADQGLGARLVDMSWVGLTWNNEGCSGEDFRGNVVITFADPPDVQERHVCGTFNLACTDPDSGATLAIEGQFDSVGAYYEPLPGQ